MTWQELIENVLSRNPSEEELRWWCEKLNEIRETNK